MPHSPHIAQSLLQRAHSPDTASAIFTDKVLRKPLHLRPTSPDPSSKDARSQRRLKRLRKDSKSKKKAKVKPLSAKAKRVLGIHDIPDHARRYELYEPLHHMWLGYMWEIMGMNAERGAFVTPSSKGSILASADYHGALISVVRSRCASHVGLSGIVVRDTKFTLQIVTKQNELKIVPKRYTVFRFEIPQPTASQTDDDDERKADIADIAGESSTQHSALIFELHGSQFENRAPDRATKKFKQKVLKDI